MSSLNAFEPIILVVHFIIAFFMIIVILLQAGKGADIGAAFGAGSSQTLFGARGAATLLSKVTTVAALLFLVTSLSLATISKGKHLGATGTSVIKPELKDEQPKVEQKAQPNQPESAKPETKPTN